MKNLALILLFFFLLLNLFDSGASLPTPTCTPTTLNITQDGTTTLDFVRTTRFVTNNSNRNFLTQLEQLRKYNIIMSIRVKSIDTNLHFYGPSFPYYPYWLEVRNGVPTPGNMIRLIDPTGSMANEMDIVPYGYSDIIPDALTIDQFSYISSGCLS